ncbi:MAG: NAD(P)H-binding protein [Chitinophagaceae bacterium]
MKIAIVIGATGLVGTQLIHLLLDDNRFSKLIVFSRRPLHLTNAKLEEHLIDFDKPGTWQHLVKGDVFCSTLGTTLKQAGGQQAQYKIDYTYQYAFAQAAAYNGVPVYVLVSSPSANPDAKFFYLRMKGELERDIRSLNFSNIHIIQPGLLVGDREQERFGEKFGYKILRVLNIMGIFMKYRPVHGKIVAQAMVKAAMSTAKGVHLYTLEDVFNLAGLNGDSQL